MQLKLVRFVIKWPFVLAAASAQLALSQTSGSPAPRGKAAEGEWCESQADCAKGLTCQVNFCERTARPTTDRRSSEASQTSTKDKPPASIPSRVRLAARAEGIEEVFVSTATVSSVQTSGGKIEYEFFDSPKIGSTYTNKLSFILLTPNPLLVVPKGTKKVAIYWGNSRDGAVTIAIERLK